MAHGTIRDVATDSRCLVSRINVGFYFSHAPKATRLYCTDRVALAAQSLFNNCVKPNKYIKRSLLIPPKRVRISLNKFIA